VVDPYPADPLNAWDLREAGRTTPLTPPTTSSYRLTQPTAYTGGTKRQPVHQRQSLGERHYRFTANATIKDLSSNALDGASRRRVLSSFYTSISWRASYVSHDWVTSMSHDRDTIRNNDTLPAAYTLRCP